MIVLLFNKLSTRPDKQWWCNLKLSCALQDVRQVFLSTLQIWQTTGFCHVMTDGHPDNLLNNNGRIIPDYIETDCQKEKSWTCCQNYWTQSKFRLLKSSFFACYADSILLFSCCKGCVKKKTFCRIHPWHSDTDVQYIILIFSDLCIVWSCCIIC